MPAVMAWDYGGVLPWSKWLLASVLLALAIAVLPLLLFQMPVSRRPLSLVIPVLLLVVWSTGWLTTVRLPESGLGLVSSGSLSVFTEWLPDSMRAEANASELPDLQQRSASQRTMSISPWHSRQANANFALFVLTLLFSVIVFRGKWTMLMAFAGVSAVGATLAFVSSLYVPAPARIADAIVDDRSFGPFINGNNAAGFLNLTLAFAVGWLAYLLTTHQDRNVPDARYRSQWGTPWEKLLQVLQLRIRHMSASTIMVLIICLVIMVGIVLTNSRGGLLGTLMGLSVVAALGVCRYFRLRTVYGVLGAAASTVCLGMLGMLYQADVRFTEAVSQDRSVSTRFEHWSDATHAAWQYLPFGSGAGTYRFAYLPFQQLGESEWFLNADNLFLEWLVEGGLWSILLLVIGVAVLVTMLLRLQNVRQAPHLTGLVVAGWFMLATQLTSQVFDFGLLLPANYLLVAILCGAVIAYHDQISRTGSSLSGRALRSSWWGGRSTHPPKARTAMRTTTHPGARSGSTRVGFAVACAAALGMVLVAQRELRAAAVNDYWVRESQLIQASVGSQADFNALARRNAQAIDGLAAGSADPVAQLELANCWIRHSRFVTVVNADRHSITPQQAWQVSSPAVLRAAVFSRTAQGRWQSLEKELPQEQYEALQQARQHALASLLLCPLNPETRAVLVDLDFIAPDPSSSGQLLSQLAELRPRDTVAGNWAMKRALVNPGSETAAVICRQHLSRFPHSFATIWPWIVRQQDIPFSLQCLPKDLSLVLAAAESPRTDAALRQALLQQAEQWLSQPDVSVVGDQDVNRGRLAQLNDQWGKAVEYYSAAADQDPANHALRFRLVLALQHQGRPDEGLKQLHRCLLQSPDNPQYLQKRTQLQALQAVEP